MPMNMIIREKRKEIGLTQEQIAEYLGVSTPAVNKWEKGTTSPDISLLPALARLLKIDVNTLLCFNEGLTEQEISCFCKEVIDTIQKSDLESGFSMVLKKVQEYPSCGALIHTTALLLDGALMMAGVIGENREKYSSQLMSLYERAAKSDNAKTRESATFMLASKYMGHEEYAKAQEMIDMLPERSAMDKRQLQADLWINQKKLAEASELLERKLLTTINEIQISLMDLADIALKEGDHQSASQIAEVSRETAKVFGLWDYCSYVVPLQVAIGQRNVEESILLLDAILSAALMPWEMKRSVLYRHIGVNGSQEKIGAKMLPALLSEIENDPKYDFLHGNPAFLRLIKEYRAFNHFRVEPGTTIR